MDCYFEDGPMKGKAQRHPDGCPPSIHMKMASALAGVRYENQALGEDIPMDLVTLTYRRCDEQLRVGAASYYVERRTDHGTKD